MILCSLLCSLASTISNGVCPENPAIILGLSVSAPAVTLCYSCQFLQFVSPFPGLSVVALDTVCGWELMDISVSISSAWDDGIQVSGLEMQRRYDSSQIFCQSLASIAVPIINSYQLFSKGAQSVSKENGFETIFHLLPLPYTSMFGSCSVLYWLVFLYDVISIFRDPSFDNIRLISIFLIFEQI